MTKMERLRKEALESCNSRGHTMKPFSRKYRNVWTSECKLCDKGVYVCGNPAPNEIDISGEAVALHCEDSSGTAERPIVYCV